MEGKRTTPPTGHTDSISKFLQLNVFVVQGPAKKWEDALLSLGVAGSKPGIDGEEIAPQAKENVATP